MEREMARKKTTDPVYFAHHSHYLDNIYDNTHLRPEVRELYSYRYGGHVCPGAVQRIDKADNKGRL